MGLPACPGASEPISYWMAQKINILNYWNVLSNGPGPLNISHHIRIWHAYHIFHIRIYYIDFTHKHQMEQCDRHITFKCDVQRTRTIVLSKPNNLMNRMSIVRNPCLVFCSKEHGAWYTKGCCHRNYRCLLAWIKRCPVPNRSVCLPTLPTHTTSIMSWYDISIFSAIDIQFSKNPNSSFVLSDDILFISKAQL